MQPSEYNDAAWKICQIMATLGNTAGGQVTGVVQTFCNVHHIEVVNGAVCCAIGVLEARVAELEKRIERVIVDVPEKGAE